MLTEHFKKCSIYPYPTSLFMETLCWQNNIREHSLAADAKSTETEGHKEEREGRNEAQAQLRKKETQEERTEPEGQDKGLRVQAIQTPSSPQQAEALTILYNPTAANLMNS